MPLNKKFLSITEEWFKKTEKGTPVIVVGGPDLKEQKWSVVGFFFWVNRIAKIGKSSRI